MEPAGFNEEQAVVEKYRKLYKFIRELRPEIRKEYLNALRVELYATESLQTRRSLGRIEIAHRQTFATFRELVERTEH